MRKRQRKEENRNWLHQKQFMECAITITTSERSLNLKQATSKAEDGLGMKKSRPKRWPAA